jgi:O-antigen ligase
MPKKQTPAPEGPAATSLVFPAMAGLFFFISILKFGSPVILDRYIDAPQDFASAFFDSWPPHWGLRLFVPVALAGLFAIELNHAKLRWALTWPLVWLGWEFVSATQTESPALTSLTLTHFFICTSLFYLGFFARKGMSNPWPIWAGMGLALCWAMRAGMEQHFGGLEATRKMLTSSAPIPGVNPKLLADPEYLKRIGGGRIFGTFGGYPNSLAAGLVLLLPVTLVFLWRLTPKVRTSIRVLFVLILGGCGLGCLYWSGSKAGWLVALVVGLVALGHSASPLKWRRWLICGALIAGVAGFAFKYAGYFQKERNSVGARFIYWHAALVIVDHHPWLGTGPGTFQISFEKIKRPTDEMARLCHNDYLEQAADSGIFGFVSYTAMILTFLFLLYRYITKKAPLDWLNFALWLGIFGLCLHSFVDFHLYVPALAWPLFFLCGWLMSRNS